MSLVRPAQSTRREEEEEEEEEEEGGIPSLLARLEQLGHRRLDADIVVEPHVPRALHFLPPLALARLGRPLAAALATTPPAATAGPVAAPPGWAAAAAAAGRGDVVRVRVCHRAAIGVSP